MVAHGVAWLDAKCPDWRSKVNVETLNIRSWSKCVLGQVFGILTMPSLPKDLIDYGWRADNEEDNQRLIEEWKQAIRSSLSKN